MKRHPTLPFFYKGELVRIDRELAPIIADLWALGIDTQNCCQQSCAGWCPKKHRSKLIKKGKTAEWTKVRYCQDRAYIAFASAEDYQAFLNLMADWTKRPRSAKGRLYNRIAPWSPGDTRHWKTDAWVAQIWLDNGGILAHINRDQMIVEDSCKKNDFRISVMLFLPRTDLDFVGKRLRKAVEKKGR
jgi:hypothetical protein